MHELLRKKYNIEVEFFGRFNRPKKITFEFDQGRFRDVLDIKEKLKEAEDVKEWLFDFLMKKTKQSVRLTRRMFDQMPDDYVANISNFIFDTYAKGFFEKSKKKHVEIDSFKNVKPPFSSLICLLLEKTNEPLESLLDMTWEQINYLLDGIIWNTNAQTESGRKKNASDARMGMMREELSDEDALKAVQELEKKMNAKKNKVKNNNA